MLVPTMFDEPVLKRLRILGFAGAILVLSFVAVAPLEASSEAAISRVAVVDVGAGSQGPLSGAGFTDLAGFRAWVGENPLPEDCLIALRGGGIQDQGRVARAFAFLEHLGIDVALVDDVNSLATSGVSDRGRAQCQSLTIQPGLLHRPPPRVMSLDPDSAPPGVAVVGFEWVRRSFGEQRIELVDTRDAASWMRYEPPKPFSDGHIPHALPFPVSQLLLKEGKWDLTTESIEEGRRAFGNFGPRPGTVVPSQSTFVLYGHGPDDDDPYIGYLTLRFLGFDARVFAAGWRHWAAEPEAPRVRIVAASELSRLVLARQQQPTQFSASEDGWNSRALVFDARTEADWRLRHIPTALSLPAFDFEDRFESMVFDRVPDFDRTRDPVAFYCYGVDCIRSRNCSTWATRAGFLNVLWLRDGLEGWTGAGLPLASTYPEMNLESTAND